MGAVVGERWPLRFAMGLLAGFSGLYALYCLAKWWQEEEEEEDRRSEHCQSKKQNLLRRAIGLRVDSQETADSHQECVLVKPHHGLDQQHLQVILGRLKRTSDTSIREHALVTIGNSAAFTVNQDLIRSLGGLSVIANCLLDEVTSVKVKAMNALTNLSVNIANQEELKMPNKKQIITTVFQLTGKAGAVMIMNPRLIEDFQMLYKRLARARVWIPQVLKIQETATLNSELQIAGLRMLTNISVVNSHHHMMTNSIPHFLKLLVDGTENVKIQALKILVNLSANPELTHVLLCAQVSPLFLFLFDNTTNKEVLIRMLIFVVNLKENMNLMQGSVQYEYNVESLHSVLFGNPTQFSHKIAKLVLYQDHEVKQHIARIMI